MQKLAIYDMDLTITDRPTYPPFLFHMVRARSPWRFVLVPLTLFGLAAYGLKLVGRASLKTYNQRLLLGSKANAEKLKPHMESFADKILNDHVYPAAIKQIEKDRTEGRRLVLATASYELYVNAIAERLGFDRVIATRLELDNQGRVLPKIIGENCYGSAKLDRITSFLGEQGLAREDIHIRAYSDHVSDAPMLEFADEAVATTPSPALRKMARQRGWEIVDWG